MRRSVAAVAGSEAEGQFPLTPGGGSKLNEPSVFATTMPPAGEVVPTAVTVTALFGSGSVIPVSNPLPTPITIFMLGDAE